MAESTIISTCVFYAHIAHKCKSYNMWLISVPIFQGGKCFLLLLTLNGFFILSSTASSCDSRSFYTTSIGYFSMKNIFQTSSLLKVLHFV